MKKTFVFYDKNFYNLDDYDGEEWIPMEEFGNEFFVSNFGRIKRNKRIWRSGRQGATVKTVDASIVKQRVIPSGYTKTTICYKGIKKSYAVHRLVAMYFLENPDNLPEVNHKDGNKANNSLENLEWVSRSENQIHSSRILHPGVYGRAKRNLGKDKADEIRKYRMSHPEVSYDSIATLFQCSFSQVYHAVKKNSYSK